MEQNAAKWYEIQGKCTRMHKDASKVEENGATCTKMEANTHTYTRTARRDEFLYALLRIFRPSRECGRLRERHRATQWFSMPLRQ